MLLNKKTNKQIDILMQENEQYNLYYFKFNTFLIIIEQMFLSDFFSLYVTF